MPRGYRMPKRSSTASSTPPISTADFLSSIRKGIETPVNTAIQGYYDTKTKLARNSMIGKVAAQKVPGSGRGAARKTYMVAENLKKKMTEKGVY